MKVYTALYDLAVGPVSYDFATWLIAAEMEKRKAGADHLHVLIAPTADGVGGWFRDKTALYGVDEMHWRLWHLVMPLCRLVGATVALSVPAGATSRLAASWREREPMLSHHAGPLIAAARAGAEIPRFSAGEHALRAVRAKLETYNRPVVTITLRDTYEEGRNADHGAWRDAARYIRAYGYEPIVLQDTAVALARCDGFFELDVELRMALYQSAAMNMHCHGGPATLCWFSDAPWVMFDAAMPYEAWAKHWEKYLGLQWEEQLPWSRKKDQKLVYEHANYETIIRHLERWAGATS